MTEYPEPDKLCALTFDDGPDSIMTTRVLDKLEKYEISATFFVIGRLVNENTKPVLERMISMGCEIANHSYEWKSMDTMTAARIRESIENTSNIIEKYAGVTPKFFRPPNGAMSNIMYETIDLPFAGGIIGYDWQGCDNDAQKIADNVLENMRDGAIIVLHDVQPEPHPTPEALDIIIPALKKDGYAFITLSELFDRKNVDPDVEYRIWWCIE
jgi:peptidoglycan/xylan/chitin deacetylase (PgdA/CDA1 family)